MTTTYSDSNCPLCGPVMLRPALPLLDGTPVRMCTTCHRIDTAATREERKDPS